jgi:RimJ/RimL family protein N-acetyltransferase
MEPTSLTTERLLLRPFRPQDADAVYTACQDPQIPRFTPVPSPYTRRHAETYVGRTCPDGWREDTAYSFALVTKDEGRFVGAMALVRLQLRTPERQAELGYWTAKEQRGRGYTAEAGLEVARWAFRELGVERLEWVADATNVASRAVALKIGFAMEGTLRAKIPQRGTRRDAWIGSLLPYDLELPSQTPYLPGEKNLPGERNPPYEKNPRCEKNPPCEEDLPDDS